MRTPASARTAARGRRAGSEGGASVTHARTLTAARRDAHPIYWHDRHMLIAFSITPLGGDDSVGDLVAEAVRVVRASGLPNRTDAMFTTVEGEWDEVMAVVKRAVDVVAARAPRVSVVLKADVRPGVTDALTGKVARIEARLAEG